MQTTNPFELIISRLDELQSTVNNISDRAQKETTKPPVEIRSDYWILLKLRK